MIKVDEAVVMNGAVIENRIFLSWENNLMQKMEQIEGSISVFVNVLDEVFEKLNVSETYLLLSRQNEKLALDLGKYFIHNMGGMMMNGKDTGVLDTFLSNIETSLWFVIKCVV